MWFISQLWRRLSEGSSGGGRPQPADAPVSPHPVAVSAPGTDRFLVMREAVLDRAMGVAGYVFSQAGDRVSPGTELEREKALLRHVRGEGARSLVGDRTLFVTTTLGLLCDPAVDALAGTGAVLLLRAASLQAYDSAAIERIRALKRKGLEVGLADGRAALESDAVAGAIGTAFFSVADFLPPDLVGISRRLSRLSPGLKLGVRALQTQDEFDACCRLNFVCLQGPFVGRRGEWSRNRANPSALLICDLLGRVRGGAELRNIAAQVKLDPMLSYRILRLANTAAIGSARNITSIEETILIVGRDPLYRWLVLLLCVAAPPSPGHVVRLENALARGRLMELLAGADTPESERQALFLTGVFSLLDLILKVPMASLLSEVKLPAEVGDAIAQRTGPWALPLQLAEACELPDAGAVAGLCEKLELEPERFNAAMGAAGVWARETVRSIQG